MAGRVVGIVVGDEADLAGASALQDALVAAGVTVRPIGPHGGSVVSGEDTLPVDRTLLTVRSIELDAVVAADGVSDGLAGQSAVHARLLLGEAFRHAKPVAAWRGGATLLTAAGIDTEAPGVLVRGTGAALADELLDALALHRVWDRFPPAPLGSA